MDLYQIISYPLYVGAVLEAILGIALLKQAPRQSRALRGAAILFFSSALFALFTAISYTLESEGRSYNFFNRASWIGWFMIPACLQFAYYLQYENSRAGRIVGWVLYPFWTVVLAITLFTDWVEPGDPSLIPFVDLDGPLEKPLRIVGTLLAFWLLVVLYRAKNRVTGIKKAQFNLFFYGTLFFNLSCIMVAGVLPLFGAINPAFTTFFSLPWVIITYYAITRHHLFDLRLLVSRALNVVILSLLFAALHLGLFQLLSPVLGNTLGILLSLAVIGMVIFGTQFSHRVQRWVQHLVLQDRYSYQEVLKESIQALVTILNQDELLAYLIHSIKKSLGVESICLSLRMQDGKLAQLYGDGTLKLEKQSSLMNDDLLAWLCRENRIMVREELEGGTASDDTAKVLACMTGLGAELLIPLVYKGSFKGVIMLGKKGSGDSYVQSDIELLESLAGHAVVAIVNAQLYDESRRLNESYLESEEKFRTLADTATMGIFIHQGGNFLYTNRYAELVCGYTRDEFLDLNFMSLTHPDYVEMVKQRARERLEGGQPPPQYEFKIVRKDRKERWVLMTAGITTYEGKPAVIGTIIDITKRKEAEEERENYYQQLQKALQSFKESERRFRTLAETTAAGILIEQAEKVVYTNPAVGTIVGYTDQELAVMSTMDLIHPDYRDLVRERGRARMAGEPAPAEYEIQVLAKTGEARWVNAVMGIIEFAGKPATLVTTFDITARKKAEEQRHLMSSLVENSSDFIGIASMDGFVLQINSAGKKMVGIENVKGTHISEYFLQCDLPALQENLLPNDAWRGEFRLKHFVSGAPIPIDLYGFTIFDENTRKPNARAVVIRDITTLKLAQAEREQYYLELQQAIESLKESESRFRTLAETTTAGIVINQGGKYIYANSACSKITGYSVEELLNMNFWDIIHPEYKDLIKTRGLSRLRGATLPMGDEIKLSTKNGVTLWCNYTAGRIDFDGAPAVVVTFFDITDRKRAEAEQFRLYEENVKHYQARIAEEKKYQLEKEQLTRDLHDGIGGITTNISLLADLARNMSTEPQVNKMLVTISDLARGGIAEIRGFLQSLDARDLTWQVLIAELRILGSNMVEPHGISFDMSATLGEVPHQPNSILCMNLYRIYKEALTNIVKHAGARNVRVVLIADSDELVLSIGDDGAGLDKKRPSGRGLLNMQTRATEMKGQLIMSKNEGHGMLINLKVPLT